MPNIKSAKKRLRTAAKSREGNQAARSRVTTTRRKLKDAIQAENREAADQAYREYCAAVDKAAKRGAIKKNTADRRKSRAYHGIEKTFAQA